MSSMAVSKVWLFFRLGDLTGAKSDSMQEIGAEPEVASDVDGTAFSAVVFSADMAAWNSDSIVS